MEYLITAVKAKTRGYRDNTIVGVTVVAEWRGAFRDDDNEEVSADLEIDLPMEWASKVSVGATLKITVEP